MSATNLNSDLSKINAWVNQWKMTFTSDPNKQAQEVIFSRKAKQIWHPPLNFNNKSVQQVQFQKHLGVSLDGKLDFREHLQNMVKNINKIISLLRKPQNKLPRAPLITIYKSFVRPPLDYEDILYDQTFNNSFHERLESIQYNAAPAITGAIRGSSRVKLYQELGFESLQIRRWYRKLCLFFKVIKNQSSKYLFELIPTARQAYMTRHKNSVSLLNVKYDYSDDTVNWFHSYLTNRAFLISIESKYSSISKISCDVLPGSILYPLLFLIYVNHIKQAVSSDLLLYADDSCLVFWLKHATETEKHFSNLCEWFLDNKLSIHFGENKTKFILFGSKRKLRKVVKLNITYQGIDIKPNSQVTYLGCILDETMSGEPSAYETIKKINSGLNYLFRKKHFLTISLRRLLCNALIQPHCVHCVVF